MNCAKRFIHLLGGVKGRGISINPVTLTLFQQGPGNVRIPVKPITQSSPSRSPSPVKPITCRSEATREVYYRPK